MKYQHQNAIDLFLEAVRVSSPSFREQEMAKFVADYAKSRNWPCKIEIDEVSPSMLNADMQRQFPDKLSVKTLQTAITIEATDQSKQPIFLCAHIDTVDPGIGVKPIVHEDGTITSDGTTVLGADDKSGVAAILAAVDEVIRQNLPHGKLVLLFTAMEEPGHIGANLVKLSKYGIKYGYVFDTMMRVGRIVWRAQHGQTLKAVFTASNIPNHTYACTVPNSLTAAVEVAAKLQKYLSDKDNMTFGQVIGLESAYDDGYMVPCRTTLRYVLRSFDKAQQAALAEAAEKALAEVKYDNVSVQYEFTPKETIGYETEKIEGAALPVQNVLDSLKEMNIEPEFITMGLGNHDSSAFIKQGVPAIVLSCGMQNIHTTSEWVAMQDISDCCELVRKLIAKA